ncbi:MAG: hypothetical protein AAB914_00010, partial [Patescibacteria group bacterium]
MIKNKKLVLPTLFIAVAFSCFAFIGLVMPSKTLAATCGTLTGEAKDKCDGSIGVCGNSDKDANKKCRSAYRDGWAQSIEKKGSGNQSFCKKLSGKEKEGCEGGINGGNSYYKTHPTSSGSGGTATQFPGDKGSHQCGNLKEEDKNVKTKINFGCLGSNTDDNPATSVPEGTGPIEDLMYALIRFLSNGVGIMMVIALVAAGIQYTTSEG